MAVSINPSDYIAGVPSSMVFPSNLGTYPFWMSFSFYEYKRPKFSGAPILSNKNTIRLPLPNQMMDHQDVIYTQEEAGLTAGTALNSYLESGGTKGNVTTALGIAAAGTALGADRLAQSKNAALLNQLGGVAVNPFLTVMFKSPAFKKHQLSWRLSPTNTQESQALANIITTLRYNQLPDISGAASGSLLTYPNIIQVSVSNPSAFLYRFRPAVIESLSINFTPGGQPSFFGSTKAPTEIEIRISLLEIEYYLQRDYGQASTAGLNFLGDIGTAISEYLPTGTVTQQQVEDSLRF